MNGHSLTAASGSKLHSVFSFWDAVFDPFLKICVALGVGLRFLWVGKRELWYDEVLSVLFSSGQKNAYQLPDNVPFAVKDFAPLLSIPPENSILDSVETVKNLLKADLSEPHPPLVYLVTHGMMRLFGNGEIAVRSLILLMSLVALVASYYLGRRVLGQRGGWIFVALLALNPFFLSQSLNLRMYSPLVLWAMLSGLCLLMLMGVDRGASNNPDRCVARPQGRQAWLLRCGLMMALAAGLMTQYLFGYWFFSLAALVLYLDRKHWLQQGFTIVGGFVLFLPWGLWGTLKQVDNRRDVLERLSSVQGPLQSALQHGKDLAQTLANYLLLGDLTTSMQPLAEPIKPTAVAIGFGAIGFVVMCVIAMYRRRQYWVLVTCSLMGLFPLLLALGVDVVGSTNTLGFGWGRATIVVLPGCVLLLAAWLEVATGRWRSGLTAAILMVYLAVNVGDFEGRDRQMFTYVNHELLKADEPTLVVMNSRSWGHVLRLVYYLDGGPNPDVLVADPNQITAALQSALSAKAYRQVLWLRADYPVWGKPKTAAEAEGYIASTEALLQGDYRLLNQQTLSGTMNVDHFELQVYQSS